MRTGTIALAGAAALAAASLGGRAFAVQTAPATPATPAMAAPVDTTACRACHGANGVSRNQHVPNLAGQQAAYLVLQLQAFKNGTRRNDVMQAIAAQLSDAEMNALAEYWHGLPPAGGGDVHAAAAGPAIPSRMAFPADFPNGFTLYQTVTTNGAVAERYANAAAVAAARAGRPLPDGAVIVVVNRPAAGAPPASYAAMEARAGWGDAIPALLRNGDWDFAVFNAQRARNDGLNQAQCLACHRPQGANSHVFTLAELRTAAQAGH
ncbi:MAG: cytochrome P460 family protein [Sphingomonadaceae bacterium]|nr:cytochrome P460 family protein [Sphingomonadaceae bacterium]